MMLRRFLSKSGFLLTYCLFFLAVLFGVHDDRPSTPIEQFFIWSSFGLVTLWLAVKGYWTYRIRRAAAVGQEHHPDVVRGVMAHLRATIYFQILLTLIYVGICTGIIPRPGDFLPDGMALGFAFALLMGAILSIWIVVENLLFGLLGWRKNVTIIATQLAIAFAWVVATLLPDVN